ncbi:hypothetical protein MFLAVUS_005712 [Mucor flavus]|uniref:Sec1-like protein n=1 Tax=Mucor flavus TaxID=439312 RepID=A0ABP9YZH6_9FUNG
MTSGIAAIMQKRLMESIRSVQPPGKWKIIVVDSKSSLILNAACKMYDILEENVTLVENIERKRQAYPTLEAIYFLTPCRESILRLVDDFSRTPTYKAAHVHFTSGLNDQLFADLNQRLKSTGASDYVQSLKELYVDFMVKESAVFTVDPTTSFLSVFGQDPRSDPDESLRTTAKQLLSVCATLGEDPIIRYQTRSEGDIHPQGSPAGKLAHIVQKEVDGFCRLNPNFPPPRQPPQPRATLLIVDRSIDPAAPLLHEFTYQAMINDLLPVEESENGVKYGYEYTQADGSIGSKDVMLDEQDNIYKSIRHMHIAECTDRLIEKFNEFLSENKVGNNSSTSESKSSAKSLKDMKEMLTNLPQFQDLKAKYSAHLSIAQECMSFFERHKLNSVGNLEQNMVTGETADGETPKTIVLDMVPLLDDPNVSQADKARLLMLYIIWKEGGIFEDDKRKLIEHAKLKGEYRDAVNNLPLIGVKLTRIRQPEKTNFLKKRRQKKNKDEETPYELSRYVPTLKKVMDAHLSNTLDPNQFAFTRQSDMEPGEDHGNVPGQGGIPASGVSLRTTKPTWSKRANSITGGVRAPTHGAKLIVFVIGGTAYSEIRSAYEIGDAYNRDVFIGSTEILRPHSFIDHLGHLRLPVPSPVSVIAPYVAPAPPQIQRNDSSTSKTASLMSHMHISSPGSLHSKASNLSLDKMSAASSHSPSLEETGEKKKKKKGLARLFG